MKLTLSVPPSGTASVNDISSCSRNSNVGSRDRDQRSRPLFVSESGGSGEDNLGALGELGQVEGGSGWDDEVGQGDCGARSFALGDSCCTCGAGES